MLDWRANKTRLNEKRYKITTGMIYSKILK